MVLTTRRMRYAASTDCDEDDIECGTWECMSGNARRSHCFTGLTGAPGESIYGDAIPGSGPQGGGAYPGTPGPSDGGQVIESGDVVDGDGNTNTPGAGGISRSGTAEGGDGRS